MGNGKTLRGGQTHALPSLVATESEILVLPLPSLDRVLHSALAYASRICCTPIVVPEVLCGQARSIPMQSEETSYVE